MISKDLAKRLQSLEEHHNVKRELPWDCKNLMSYYRERRAEQSIIYKLQRITGEACNPPEHYLLEVDNQKGLSREAREFLSLPAEKQGIAVNRFCPGWQMSEEEAAELRRDIIEKVDKIRIGMLKHP